MSLGSTSSSYPFTLFQNTYLRIAVLRNSCQQGELERKEREREVLAFVPESKLSYDHVRVEQKNYMER